jgi:uncharacterized protein YqgC (DUF456 family)
MSEIFLIVSVFILFSIATVGIFVPFLPGVFVSWLAVLIFALNSDFTLISVSTVVWLFLLFILTIGVDFIAPIIGAKKHKASMGGIVGTALGFFFGFMMLGFPGIVIGPIAGAFLGELANGRSHKESTGVALGSFLGFLVGSLFKIIVIAIMFGIFLSAII